MIGIRTVQVLAADFTKTSNVVFSDVLATPIAAGSVSAPKKQILKFWLPLSVGATGGLKLQVAGPAGIAAKTTIRLNNTVAPSQTIALQTAPSTPFTNALANAGNHWIEGEVYVENTGVAGSVSLQMCQNTSDALTLTVFKGGSMEVIDL